MKRKKIGMKLEAVSPVGNSSLRTPKTGGSLNPAYGQQSVISNRIKKKIPTDPKNYSGLCSCCGCAPACTYPREPGRQVLQCEEFDGISFPLKQMQSVEKSSVSFSSGPPVEVQSRSTLRGLCAYCEKLDACTYPKHEGGVWHCEEFS